MSFVKPLPADAQIEKAITLHKAGKLGEAEQIYKSVLQTDPKHAEAQHNLGVILAQRGAVEQSLPLFHAALEAKPSEGLYWMSYARALITGGHAQDAVNLLEQGREYGLSGAGLDAMMAKARGVLDGAVDVNGLYAAAIQHHQNGRGDQAIALYRKIIAIQPDHMDSHDNLGNALGALGKFDEAIAVYRSALEIQPDNADLLDSLGYALTAKGDFGAAIEAYRKAISIRPDFVNAHYHLGSVLSENGHVAEGFAHFMKRAELLYGTGKPPPVEEPEPAHKIKHDREQRDYLFGNGNSASDGLPQVNDIFHLADGARVARAVNPANLTPELMETWRTSFPQLVVIENFLTPEALQKLRDYCAGSTVWKRLYSAGYIGATPPDGFACPLLAQIVEEISETFTEVFAGHLFHYLGAFKYDSELSTGTNTHADFSAVNVNFYIAPDDANLDPNTGGMEIWDVEARDEAEMRRLNRNEPEARAFLKSRNAKSLHIPHRQNRAILFKSSFIHKTDDCSFKEGYLNKRINVSLLYGKLGAPTK